MIPASLNTTIMNWVDLSVDLVSFYSMENNVGTTLTDDSGNGNNGTISGAVDSVGVDGGNALDFDGVNDFCSISSVYNGSAVTTISVWCYIAAAPSVTEIIYSQERTSTPAGSNRSIIINTDGTFRAITRNTSGGNASIISAVQPFPNWFNIILRQDGAALDLDVGVLGSTLTHAGAAVLSGTPASFVGPGRIGCRVNIPGTTNELFFDGKVDLVREYDTYKSDDFVQALFGEV